MGESVCSCLDLLLDERALSFSSRFIGAFVLSSTRQSAQAAVLYSSNFRMNNSPRRPVHYSTVKYQLLNEIIIVSIFHLFQKSQLADDINLLIRSTDNHIVNFQYHFD